MLLVMYHGQMHAIEEQLKLLRPIEADYRMPVQKKTVKLAGNKLPKEEEETPIELEEPPIEEENEERVGNELPKEEEETPIEPEDPPIEEEKEETAGNELPKEEEETPIEPEEPPIEEENEDSMGSELPKQEEEPSLDVQEPPNPEEHPEEVYPVKMNGFLVDEQQMIIGIDLEQIEISGGYLELPMENCVGIRSGAFSSCGNSLIELYIPSNITTIEAGAFSGLPNMEWLEVDGSNPNFTSIDGVVYSSDGLTMFAVPSARTGTQLVPGNVKQIAPMALDATQLSALDMRKCGEIILLGNIFGAGNGSGIVIHVDGLWEDVYRSAFSGYEVEIKGYQR